MGSQEDYVLLTAAGRVYAEGIYRKIRVRQNNTTAATGPLLLVTKIGS